MGIPTITVASEGQRLDSSTEILSLEIHRDLDRIPVAELTLVDGSVAKRRFEISDGPLFEPGRRVTIALRDGDAPDTTLFDGRVIRHAVESKLGGCTLRIELKDLAFSLTRQRKSAVYRDGTDADALQRILTDAQLEPGVMDTPPSNQHGELVRYGSTDWDFLLSRADAQGLVVDVDQGKVSLRAMVPAASPKARLEHGLDEVELELELDGGDQWAVVTSAGWDPQALTPTPPAQGVAPNVTVGNIDAAAVATQLGGDTLALLHPGLLTQDDLNAWASARLTRTRMSLLRGRASIPGRPDLAPLDVVELAGVGERFDGLAIVTGTSHRVDQGGWRTELRFGLPPEPFARRPDVAELPAGGLVPPVHGLHVGVVDQYEADPQGLLRVKVLLAVHDGTQGPVFARVAHPDAGNGRGVVFWPVPGDEVVVGFVNDDPGQAIVLGALHGPRLAPPQVAGGPSQANDLRAIVTKSGLVLGFDDRDKVVRITTPSGKRLTLDEGANAITLEDENRNVLTLDANGITLSSGGDVTIEAAGHLVLQGQTVDVQ